MKLSFRLEFQSQTRLPTFIGNTIRGALGAALSREYCIYEKQQCVECAYIKDCIYGSVFKVQNEESIPNPYVVSSPYPSQGSYEKGDTLDFSISLFGSACRFVNELVDATNLMCTGNLKNAKLIDANLEYNREWSDEGAESIEYCDNITIHFDSPVEMISRNEALKDITFGQLIDSLFGRIAGIIDNYSDKEFVIPYSLLGRKPYVEAKSQLRSVRFSMGSQAIEGVIGTISYFGDMTRYLPYIDLGTQLHIGKKTTRGFGEYSFEI